jgi:hypothetical protein
MARFVPLLGSLRGRIGANIFSHNKGGDYVRLGTAPTNPNSTRQQAVRVILGDLAQAWTNTLTVAQRAAWNTWAEGHPIQNSLGQDIYISGLAWYERINARLIDAGDSALTNPPVQAPPGSFATFSCDISAATTVDVTYTAALAADERLQLWQTLPGSAGASPNFKQARLVGYSAAAAASPIAMTLPHSVVSGQTCRFFGCRIDDEGQIGAYSSDDDTSDY